MIVHEQVYDELQKRLVAAAEGMRLGPGWEDETDVGPVINRAALEKIHSYTGIGKDEGATLLTGGEPATGDELGNGFYYRPTIFADVEPDMRIAQEEIFGPTTALIPVKDFDEAIRVANGVTFGLSSSIFTRDVNRAFRAMRDLRPGITYINAARSAPRCTCRSAARRTPATATARPARRRSTSSPSGSRSTSTTPASSSARRSTTPRSNRRSRSGSSRTPTSRSCGRCSTRR